MTLKTKFTAVFFAAALLTAASAYAEGEPVYNVTFDDVSSEYELVSASPDDRAQLVEGESGKAVDLSGGAYVKLKDDLTFNMTGDYSIAVDVMPRTKLSFARVFDIGTGTDNTLWLSCYGGELPKMRFNGNDLISNSVGVKVGEWNHIVITREGTEAKLFINGVIAATSNSFYNDLSLLGQTDKNYLGRSQYETDPGFDGQIDNFAVYDYALNEGQIVMEGDPRLEMKGYYVSDNAGVLTSLPKGGLILHKGDVREAVGSYEVIKSLSAAAQIKNYTTDTKKIKLISVVYDADMNPMKIVSSAAEPASREVISMTNQLGDPADFGAVKTYIYTEPEGMRLLSEITADGIVYPAAAPQDTLETTIGVHDPSIFKDPQSGTYYVYSTGMIDIFKSDDLINWTKSVNTLPALPQCVLDKYEHDTLSQYSNIWAPDMYYNEDDKMTPYYLTCSYSDEFGKNSSSIILFKASSPEGPWENGKIIFSTNKDDESTNMVNAIDSNIHIDAATGKKYMLYGSFWQGIHQLELDDSFNVTTSGIGRCIESRYLGIGGPEGGYVIYNPETEYYYLFTSYDNLANNYNIRVARSRNIEGPYSDQNGESVNRHGDNKENQNRIFGYKLMGSYQFEGETTYFGPGHNSVLYDNGEWYLVHHTRVTNGGLATLHVRKMLWTDSGWPIVSPERYAGEEEQALDAKAVEGEWDFISIGDNTNAMLMSDKLTLYDDGTAATKGNSGSWSISGSILTLDLPERHITAHVLPSYDRDRSAPNLVFTGIDGNDCEVWGKKAENKIILR